MLGGLQACWEASWPSLDEYVSVRFSDVNQLSVNLAKCKCVTFNKKYRQAEGQFTYKGQPIASSFVYLGTTFYSNTVGTGNTVTVEKQMQRNVTTRISKAKALAALRLRCAELDIHNAALRCSLFNALVAPVFASGSEMWGVYMSRLFTSQKGWGTDSEAERLHRSFLRWAFGMLPNSVDSVVLLLESGRVPLVHGWVKQLLTWYNKIVQRQEIDLVRRCLVESLTFEGGWSEHFLRRQYRSRSSWQGEDASGLRPRCCARRITGMLGSVVLQKESMTSVEAWGDASLGAGATKQISLSPLLLKKKQPVRPCMC